VRVLAVDDSLTIRKALELILIPAGHDVTFAASGAEALAQAQQAPPGVILLDFILPDMRGSEVCRQLRDDPRTAQVPVVLISARGAEIQQAYHDAPNVVRYLPKPFTPEDVLAVVAEIGAAGLAVPAQIAAAAAEIAAPEQTRETAPTVQACVAEPGVQIADSVAGAAPDEAAYAAAEDTAEDPAESAVPLPGNIDGAARGAIETMLEALRGGLEGVYVEELDTSGALADRARSYTDVATRLREQLGEALRQAESGASAALCDDGSIRSLADTLLDSYRRVCRLLFRAAASGALEAGTATAARPRVLIACHRDSPVYPALARAADEAGEDWIALRVAADFRQLPMTVRLFGPTHVLVDAGRAGPAWEQVQLARRLPEGRRMQVVGLQSAGSAADASVAADAVVVPASADLLALLRSGIAPHLEAAA
jgi:CheY-like chemotaxis protein